jgi:hypothetical protein
MDGIADEVAFLNEVLAVKREKKRENCMSVSADYYVV